MPRLALLLALAVAPAWSGTINLELMVAEKQLRDGMVRQAADGFRRYLESHPNSGRAKVGLASALASIGRCDEALEMLVELRTRRAWSAAGATTEATCLQRAGDESGAIAAYEEAIWLSPKDAGAWTGLALLASARGDLATVERASDELLLLRRGEMLEALVAAQVAYEQGDPSFDVRLAELEALVGGPPGAHLQLLDALRWLDLDDPRSADEALFRAVRRDTNNLQLAVWRAEAARRLGDTHDARSALDRPLIRGRLDAPIAIALEARLLVDEGDVAAAEARLATHPAPDEVEALASAWYIARARGDTQAAASLAARWQAAVRGRTKRLEHLVPVNQRETP